jgi:aldehyde dehydrogenase (NAD+)
MKGDAMTSMKVPTGAELRELARATVLRCGVDLDSVLGDHPATSPINGGSLAEVAWSDAAAVDEAVCRAQGAFREWRIAPAPARGAVV